MNEFASAQSVDMLRQDLRSTEARTARLEVRVDQIATQIRDQTAMLNDISASLHRQDEERAQRDRALRKVIWAANMLGPKSLALAALLVSLLYEWLRR